ncbi:MAG: HAD family hydrolase [Deltaproteobacteria bacterium]|jgi:soluble P-type ATPase|nr:MAG: HAD family hydrolase [Deltaproteobacteria bacterium]
MKKRGLNLEIPGWGLLRLRQGLFDLNGTLCLDGILPETVQERLHRLQDILEVYVITADTHGTVADLVRDFADLEIARIQAGNEAWQKRALLERLGASHTVALGNGANDALMLRGACLGICVMQGEGISSRALLASDVLVRSAEEALDLLLKPDRLVATLRS